MFKNSKNQLIGLTIFLISLLIAGNACATATFNVIDHSHNGISPRGEILQNFDMRDISYQQNPSSVIYKANPNGPALQYKSSNGGLGIMVGSYNIGEICNVTVSAVLTANMEDPTNKPYAVSIPDGNVDISITPKSTQYICNAAITSSDTVTVNVYKATS